MSEIIDDKAPHVIPFILEQLDTFHAAHTSARQPFFIGLNGVQGAGKSVLVDILLEILQTEPYNLPTVVCSVDDFYLTHNDQVALAKSHPDNPLLQHRGQPSTHEVALALSTFKSLKDGQPTKIPSYNKAAFSGQGDRLPEYEWKSVNTGHTNPIRVVLFEGWCVGFRPLTPGDLRSKHTAAVSALQSSPSTYRGRLGHNTFQSVADVNVALADYDAVTDQLDAFIHLDAADPQYVYAWRLEQEQGLRTKSGSGMTDEDVKKFVDGYYPAYELYTDTLREGVFKPRHEMATGKEDWKGRQLRMVVNRDRKVCEVVRI